MTIENVETDRVLARLIERMTHRPKDDRAKPENAEVDDEITVKRYYLDTDD